MLKQVVYSKDHSREIGTSLNFIGVSTSYCEVKSTRKLLAGYAAHTHRSEEGEM